MRLKLGTLFRRAIYGASWAPHLATMGQNPARLCMLPMSSPRAVFQKHSIVGRNTGTLERSLSHRRWTHHNSQSHQVGSVQMQEFLAQVMDACPQVQERPFPLSQMRSPRTTKHT